MHVLPDTAIMDRLRSVADLPYDHDGAGGLPIRDDVHEFLNCFMLGYLPFDRAPDPEVTLRQDGTVLLVFHQDGLTLSLDVLCAGVVTYLKVFPDGQTEIEGSLIVDGRSGVTMVEFYREMTELLAWVGGFAP